MDGGARSAQEVVGDGVRVDETAGVLSRKGIHVASLSVWILLRLIAVFDSYFGHVFAGSPKGADVFLSHSRLVSCVISASFKVEIGV